MAGGPAQTVTTLPDRLRGAHWGPDGGELHLLNRATGEHRLLLPTAAAGSERTLVWVDREGNEERIPAPAAQYVTMSVSPDGERAALAVDDGRGSMDIWISELARGTLTRLTTDAAIDHNPLWDPEGRRVVFRSDRNGHPELFWQPADGSEPAELLLSLDEPVVDIIPGSRYRPSWSPDGDEIVYLRAPNGPPEAVMRVSVDATRDPASLVVGQPVKLFDFVYAAAVAGHRYYDLSADAERLLVIATGAGASHTADEINIVLNWHQELLERVPVE